jgi:protein MpaA
MDFLLDLLLDLYGPVPYAIIFSILIACGFGLPIPEDITLFAAGALAYYGVVDFFWILLLSFVGVMLGDSIMFMLGARYGRKLTRVWIFRKLLPDDRLDQVGKSLNEKGVKLLFAARFMPGLRAPIFFSAGALHIPFRKFFFYDGLAALLSVPAIVGAVFYFGDTLDHVIEVIKHVENGIVVLIFSTIGFLIGRHYWQKRKNSKGQTAALVLLTLLPWLAPISAQALESPKAAAEITQVPQNMDQLCSDLRTEIRKLKWDVEPCEGLGWIESGKSLQGRPLVHGIFGDPQASNTSLVLSMVHGDEVTPLYVVLKLAHWLRENQKSLQGVRVVLAPLVNPDSFFRNPRTRVNAAGVDVNRNFPTRDWDAHALNAWKTRFKSNPRRFPGHKAGSEVETKFQQDLIHRVQPQKILSIHAPLNFMDYDGPTTLALARFPKDYVQECLKLRKQLKAVHGGFFPGSLGNYAGQELGIPTLTLELPSADPHKAHQYWERFKTGIRSMIEFQMPEVAQRGWTSAQLETSETTQKQ